ncbi:hypothetical protein HS125_18165 [bacterium]|nr:hypothetical protein [bacterium]
MTTDNSGALYRIAEAGAAETLLRAPGDMALSLLRAPDGRLWAGTGNPGAVVHIQNELAEKGELLSDVKDFGVESRFGRIDWESSGSGSLAFSTRSGNVAKPDETWSAWSKSRTSPGDVESPAGRFLQWKAEFKRGGRNESPRLEKVSVAARQVNRAPQITQLNLGGAPAQPPQPPSQPGSGAPSGRPDQSSGAPPSRPSSSGDSGDGGRISINWQALDPNGDSLLAKLEFRGKGEQGWLLLKDEITANNYRWETQSVPDGEYEIRLTVDDSPANPPDEVKSATLVSETFMVDNTPPRVVPGRELKVERSGRGWIAGVTLADDAGLLSNAEYCVDGGDWQGVVPEDGLFDEREETLRFRLNVEDLEPGGHTLVVRFKDREGNIGATKRAFRVEK